MPKKILILYLLLSSWTVLGQSFKSKLSFQIKAEWRLGNQNQLAKIGAYTFGTFSYKKVAFESGATVDLFWFYKKYGRKEKGVGYGYEYFVVGGYGDNHNLLGSAISLRNDFVFLNKKQGTSFVGIGFGVNKDMLPAKWSTFNQRKGTFIIRYSAQDYSIHINTYNDFKIGNLFNGEGTDYGETGGAFIGYTKMGANHHHLIQGGLVIDIFTPKPDYTRSPRNKTNSDDGRKNVWYTQKPFENLFLGNLYGYFHYQQSAYSLTSKLGVNSMKTGAYIQNKLHDGFGLNPRYPWDVSKNDSLFFECHGSIFYKFKIYD